MAEVRKEYHLDRGILVTMMMTFEYSGPMRLSNTMEGDFCVEALEEAMSRFGRPGTYSTDQGSQFTRERFTKVLLDAGVRISMDGRGR